MNTTRYSVVSNGTVLCAGFSSRRLAREWAERETTEAFEVVTDHQAGVVA
jgi:hypothetical protein